MLKNSQCQLEIYWFSKKKGLSDAHYTNYVIDKKAVQILRNKEIKKPKIFLQQ